MGIMAAGFVKGASDAFTDRMYDVITKKADLKTKIGQETATGELVEKSLLQLGQKIAQNVIKIANDLITKEELYTNESVEFEVLLSYDNGNTEFIHRVEKEGKKSI